MCRQNVALTSMIYWDPRPVDRTLRIADQEAITWYYEQVARALREGRYLDGDKRFVCKDTQDLFKYYLTGPSHSSPRMLIGLLILTSHSRSRLQTASAETSTTSSRRFSSWKNSLLLTSSTFAAHFAATSRALGSDIARTFPSHRIHPLAKEKERLGRQAMVESHIRPVSIRSRPTDSRS
jgi:hypothetical protein